MTTPTIEGHEIRRNGDGSLDEVVAWGFVHLEQMDDGYWWLGIETADGHSLNINLFARGKISALAEYDGTSDVFARRWAPR